MDEIKVIEPDDRQIELLQELTAQNRMILEALLRVHSHPCRSRPGSPTGSAPTHRNSSIRELPPILDYRNDSTQQARESDNPTRRRRVKNPAFRLAAPRARSCGAHAESPTGRRSQPAPPADWTYRCRCDRRRRKVRNRRPWPVRPAGSTRCGSGAQSYWADYGSHLDR